MPSCNNTIPWYGLSPFWGGYHSCLSLTSISLLASSASGFLRAAHRSCVCLSFAIFVLVCFLSVRVYAQPANSTPIKIAIQVGDGNHRVFIRQIFRAFERQHPEVNFELIILRDVSRYPDIVAEWLESGTGPDLIYWYAGQRIEHFRKLGQLQNIHEFWEKNELDKAYPKAIADTIKLNDRAWGIPITYFLWALYYRESSFTKYGVSVPRTWDETLAACKKLRAHDVDLFAFGSKTEWASHAWFDYINLRANGLDFYREVLAGKVAYTDERIKQVLVYWKELLDNQCFNSNYASYTIWQAFPRVLHGLSAMILSDGIPQIEIPMAIRDDVFLVPFPVIDKQLPQYTVTPVNAFVVPAYAKITPDFEKILTFISGREFQANFNAPIYRPPALSGVSIKGDSLSTSMQKLVAESPGGIQFLDRDTDIKFADSTPAIFIEFMQTRDIDKTSRALESQRSKVFGPLR